MPNPTQSHHVCSKCFTMSKNQAIEHAINDLKSQKAPNIDATAKKWGVVESTLRRRYKGKTVSRSEGQSRSNMLLTNAQEDVLIEHINKLSARNLHPTIQTVENLAREIVGHPVGERWVERFRKCHGNKLRSRYMRNIDHSRHVADNSKHFQHYFDNVSA